MKRLLEYTWIKAKAQKPRMSGATVKGIILHSTDGRKAGDIQTLTRGTVSVHWYVTRAGDIYRFVDDKNCAYHAGLVTFPEDGNHYTVGIEMEHFDGKDDWPVDQVEAVSRIVAYLRQKYGNIPVKSHAQVAYPKGRKVDPVDFPWSTLSRFYEMNRKLVWEPKRIK